MKRLLIIILALLALISNAFAGGNLSLFNQTKKEIHETSQVETTNDKKIKNLRRLSVEDLSSPDPAMTDENEEDPWDDGEDMGC